MRPERNFSLRRIGQAFAFAFGEWHSRAVFFVFGFVVCLLGVLVLHALKGDSLDYVDGAIFGSSVVFSFWNLGVVIYAWAHYKVSQRRFSKAIDQNFERQFSLTFKMMGDLFGSNCRISESTDFLGRSVLYVYCRACNQKNRLLRGLTDACCGYCKEPLTVKQKAARSKVANADKSMSN